MKRVAVMSREWLQAPDGKLSVNHASTGRKCPHEFLLMHLADTGPVHTMVLDAEHLAATLQDIFGAGSLLDVVTVGEHAIATMKAINARVLN
jgi:hypothetical protein